MYKNYAQSSLKGGEFLAQETLKIEGMACDHCVLKVGRAIASVQGVTGVDVNLETKEAVVEFEEFRTSLEKIKAAVREAGYKPL
ncbi:heavy-metal-associated domain-containing protein [Methanosarcina sp.]|uniref:heavy-metal-associated domain-containing protein n=1 Tax=Methanosarcina sp. TaxID=2213 RepID=UPI003C763C35